MSTVFLENILRLGIGFLLGVWVARHLGPEKYGYFSYIISFVAVFIPVFRAGIDEVVTIDLIQDQESKKDVLGSALAVKGIFTVFTLLLCNVILYFSNPTDSFMQLLVFIYSLAHIFRMTDVILVWFQSKVEEKKLSVLRQVVFVVSALLKFLALYKKLPVEYFVYLSGLEIVFFGLFYIYAFLKNTDIGLSWTYKKDLFVKYIKQGFPILISLFCAGAVLHVNRLLIGNMLTYKELGEFSVATKLIELWNFLPITIVVSLFPGILEKKKISDEQYKSSFKKLFALMVGLSTLFSISVFIISEPLVSLLYGSKYEIAGKLLSVYCFTAILIFFNTARAKLLIAEKSSKIEFYLSLANLILCLGLAYILIQQYGVYGAIYSILISGLVVNIYGILLIKPMKRIFF